MKPEEITAIAACGLRYVVPNFLEQIISNPAKDRYCLGSSVEEFA